jgi:putative addiction module component (TIGR02574 family)
MTREASKLLRQALALTVPERAELAGSLIESLERSQDRSVRAAWDTEIARRMEELDSGRIKPIRLGQAKRRLSSAIS